MATRATSAKVARAEGLRALADEIGHWSGGSGPLYRQLATAIARAVERGAVAHGSRLPAERALAVALSVSRGTAVAAYDQLVGDGLVERRPGSGTHAIGPGTLALPAGREGSALVARLVDRSAGPSDVVDLSLSVLHDASALPPGGVTTADLVDLAPDTGYSPWGLAGLRAAVADLLAGWGLPTRPEQVVITTGAQQAISIAAACWVRPGDLVVVDDPTYPGAVSAFAAAGADVVGVPVDDGGVQVGPLRAALAERPALVYLQSTLHSPTGVVLAPGRRAAIASLLADARVPLVEDIALAGLAWSPVPPPIAAHAPDQPIAVVGSLSKLLWGGLRLGFVRAPEPVALRFARVKATHDLGSSVVGQLLGERSLRAPTWPARAAARNDELRARYELLASLLAERLPAWRWVEPSGGLSLWVQLPRPVARPFAEVALRHGVAVATADALSPTQGHADRLRLSFAPPPADLRLGVDRLAAAWSAREGPSSSGS
ncbi:MAG: GntR family transcriptional regulator [Actinomycetia bacterium]|nr:GntR family transcriptional regulator [Actinomycetes bacterium]